jgi:hypothetical protein
MCHFAGLRAQERYFTIHVGSFSIKDGATKDDGQAAEEDVPTPEVFLASEFRWQAVSEVAGGDGEVPSGGVVAVGDKALSGNWEGGHRR